MGNWVTFDEEERQKATSLPLSDPWPISGVQSQSSSAFLSASVYSNSSFSSFMSNSTSDSRGTSPTNNPEEDSRYLVFKALRNSAPTQSEEDDTLEPSSSSNSDCKYSVFSNLRECEEKGEYLGWSKKVLGEGSMGWSETLKAKPSF